MTSDSEILAQVEDVFGRCKRPVHFTNWTHCSECEEHDNLLRSRTLETLRLQDIENPGWDPLCFITAEGFKYYFPALARITLSGSEADWYGGQLLFHLIYEGANNRHLLASNESQRHTVVALLKHLENTRTKLVAEHFDGNDLSTAIKLWSNSPASRP